MSIALTRRSVLTAGLGLVAPAFARAESEIPLHVSAADGLLDYDRPQDGRLSVRYALLAPFEPGRRIVLVVADGQQFYVTPAAFGPSVRPLFGDAFNVAGVFGRADAPEVQAQVGHGAAVDWRRAYQLLRARQWIGDLEVLRRALAGDAPVLLYGRSGGGFLVHQYIAHYPEHVAGAFTQAAVNHFLEAEFGLRSDRFWDELSPADQHALLEILSTDRLPRLRLATLFQRQNFFVDRGSLAVARHNLIASIAAGQMAVIEKEEADYQINALNGVDASPRGPAINVRLFEFFAPLAARYDAGGVLRPDWEVMAGSAAPLVALWHAGHIAAPGMDFARLAQAKGDMFLLAGRWDHTCDYRSQIALASCYGSHRLAILDDDHTFHRLGQSGLVPVVVEGALSGFRSWAFEKASAALAPLIWRE